MIYRPATPADGPEMLRLIESHSNGGKIRIIYSRRPDAYRSYLTECDKTETTLCIGEDNRLLAQLTCIPRKLYIDGEVRTIGYLTGMHKADGAQVNVMKLLDAGYARSSVKQFFCSILDDNQSAFDMLAKRGLIHSICDYTTYLFNPTAIKLMRHKFTFRRATPDDTERLLRFYNEVGSGYSYFPVFSSMDDFAGLTVSDFFILEDGSQIVAAGALWNQKTFKQYIVLSYGGIYKFAAACGTLLRALRFLPLPKVNEAANFAYISFFLCCEPALEHVLLGEISAAARNYDFLTTGAANRSSLGQHLNSVKGIKFGSRLCAADYNRSGVMENVKMPIRYECAFL
jgi:hypothetical protein